MSEVEHLMKTFPNFHSIVQQFESGDTWIPEDFPAIEYAKDVILWYLHLKKVLV